MDNARSQRLGDDPLRWPFPALGKGTTVPLTPAVRGEFRGSNFQGLSVPDRLRFQLNPLTAAGVPPPTGPPDQA
ncbi:MAG: hypothetical protein ACUVX8_18935, partial [Candidatus Zipacnadales bacterium]